MSQRGTHKKDEFDDIDMKKIRSHHNMDGKDDRNPLTDSEIDQLNRFEQFEHSMPFYLMDVCGFIMHIKDAMHNSHAGVELQDITDVSLEALATEFKKYDSWKDLGNKDSKFAKFLDSYCF